jgi:uncharacterized cupredoxin-like copper-binding protein
MFSRKIVPIIAAGLISALALGACSESAPDQGAGGSVRTIEIQALDTLRFDPNSVTVKVGERVRFVVTNPGHTQHEFILGDEEVQMAHEEEMAMGGDMGHGGEAMAALELAAGETMETTVTFDQAGTILYGCHEPGHYGGGMVGTITVTS